jgi:hypothetical protein
MRYLYLCKIPICKYSSSGYESASIEALSYFVNLVAASRYMYILVMVLLSCSPGVRVLTLYGSPDRKIVHIVGIVLNNE